MKTDLVGYAVLLITAVLMEYAAEVKWSAEIALSWPPILPWLVDAVAYALLGSFAWLALRARPLRIRVLLLALIAVVPQVGLEILIGRDSAYPYIGWIFMILDLLWIAIGAGTAALCMRIRSTAKQQLP